MRRSIRNLLSTSEPTIAASTSPRDPRFPAQEWEKPTVCGMSWRCSHPSVHTLRSVEDFASRRPPRRERPRRRPERQQILLRRGLALGGGLLLLILIVLGVKGCLDARKSRELSDYARNVSEIVEETNKTSKSFFGKLDEPGGLSVTEFISQVSADRSAMDNYAGRIDSLSAPGDMSHAQSALELTYELRASAMDEIAEKMSTALGDVGAEQATKSIAMQMRKLLG